MDALWSDPGLTTAVVVGAVGAFAYTRSRARPETVGVRTTALRGPPRESWLLGQTKAVWMQPGVAEVLEGWADTYGRVYLRPGPLGNWDIFIADPKAAASLLARSAEVYHLHALWRTTMENLFGRGLLSSDGESHKRQRKSISPGFTSVKIREYSTVFYDCAHKLVNQWESLTEGGGEYVGDVEVWLNAFSLDSIGRAGFSYDFGSLSGKSSEIATAFEVLASATLGIADGLILVLQPTFPWVSKFPTQRQRGIYRLKAAAKEIAKEVMRRTKEEKEDERSILGLLNKAETARTGVKLTESEVQTQIMTLLVAGYETTSTSLTWILIELCRHPDIQDRLRKEVLAAHPSSDPDYDELMTGLPFLDAVVHESLRVHPPIVESWKTAVKDDVLPLSEPVTLPDGSVTDKIVIAKGTTVAISEEVLNKSKALWGEDAWTFRPERWLDGVPQPAQEIAGYRHLLTFLDGPKVCLGRSFAVASIKIALAVIIRKFAFELPDGPETKFEAVQTAIHRVKTAGEKGCTVPMRIRRAD